jgi:poly-gamma-glutamate capsule biosynthesis protein CapA/YwtB (metallophosphatase superfamily)
LYSRSSGRASAAFQVMLLLLLLLLSLAAAKAWTADDSSALAGEDPTVSQLPDRDAYPWVYLRDDQELAAGEKLVSLIAVGDIMLGRGVAAAPSPLRDVSDWLPAADLALGNLEAVLTDGGLPRSAPDGDPQPILLRAGPENAKSLKQAGFDILGLANNHALDYGPAGLADTADVLQSEGLAVAGLLVPDGVQRPLIQEVNGIRLAFLAFNAVPDPQPSEACLAGANCQLAPAAWDPVSGPAAIAAAQGQAQAVIVSVHWGFE